MTESMLTTVDNEFDPFTDFDSWYNFDVENGYNTCALIARLDDVLKVVGDSEEPIDSSSIILKWFPETYKIVTKETKENKE